MQKLYFRFKDYSPQSEYRARLKAVIRAIAADAKYEGNREIAAKGHPLRRSPLFAHLSLKRERAHSLALTRVYTNYEAAMTLDCPRDCYSTGKSMLIDLLANCLPSSKKRRWHFHTFMLETLGRLEELRQSRSGHPSGDSEYSLFWLAKNMIEKCPILFLDEFQLPDRTANKILSNL